MSENILSAWKARLESRLTLGNCFGSLADSGFWADVAIFELCSGRPSKAWRSARMSFYDFCVEHGLRVTRLERQTRALEEFRQAMQDVCDAFDKFGLADQTRP